MCVDFEDAIKICDFYSGEGFPVEVDYENYYISLGDYAVDPVMENGHIVTYIVADPEGGGHLVGDLDAFFQRVLPDWEDRF